MKCRKQPDSTYRICQRWALPLAQVNLLANVELTLTSRPLSGRKSSGNARSLSDNSQLT